MPRRRRTDHPRAGETSDSQEQTGQGGPQRPPERAPVPQQQEVVGGRGQPQQQQQYGGRGGGYYQGRGGVPQPRGGTPPQYQGAQPSEHQGRGGPQRPEYPSRGGPQPRGDCTPPQKFYGGRSSSMGGGRGAGPSAAGPSRPSAPELHQATEAPTYQAQPASSQPSSSSRLREVAVAEVTQQVQQLSVQSEATTSQAIQPVASSKSVRFPLRPGKGSFGVKCVVKANHFFAELPDKDLHQYDLSITPEVTSRGVNRAVMEELVRLYRETHLGGRLPAYDGRKSLYTAGPLPFPSKEFQVTLTDEDDGCSGMESWRQRTFKIVIKFASRADLHHLEMFLAGRQADAPQEALQVLDIVLCELPTARYCPIGRSFYSPDLGKRQQLGVGLESWRGFYQSIRPTQMALSLNIDMSSTAFIEAPPTQLLNRDMSRPLSYSHRVKVPQIFGLMRVFLIILAFLLCLTKSDGVDTECAARLQWLLEYCLLNNLATPACCEALIVSTTPGLSPVVPTHTISYTLSLVFYITAFIAALVAIMTGVFQLCKYCKKKWWKGTQVHPKLEIPTVPPVDPEHVPPVLQAVDPEHVPPVLQAVDPEHVPPMLQAVDPEHVLPAVERG